MPGTVKTSPQQPSRRTGWTVFFAFLSIQALLALVWLVSIASDPKNRRLLGLSTSRLMLAAGLLIIALVTAVLAWRSWRSRSFLQGWERLTFGPLYGIWVLAGFSLALACPAAAFFLRYRSGGAYLTLFQRLLPLLAFGCAAALAALIGLAFGREPCIRERFAGQKKQLLPAAAALLGLLVLWGGMALTGLGLVPDVLPDGWGTPGVPILEGQIWLAVIAAGLLLVVALRLRFFKVLETGGWKIDLLLAAAVWLAAALAWTAQPIQTGYFTPAPRAPNFEYYPYSDAITTGLTAQDILLGLGFNNGSIITRPLYVLGLAVLHALAGPDYADVISLQTLVLAFFPVVLYFLGKLLHSRLAGLLAASFAILREVNAIAGTPYSGVSNSKLMMSDLPTALGVSLVVLLSVLWLRQPRRWTLALAAGGVLGLIALVRLQTLLVAPFLALGALLAIAVTTGKRGLVGVGDGNPGGSSPAPTGQTERLVDGALSRESPVPTGQKERQADGALSRESSAPTRGWKIWVIGTALVALGVILAVSPWPWRNWRITGRVVFDQPVESNLFAGYYSYSGRVSYPRLPGENDGDYSARLMGKVLDFVRSDPGYVARFIGGHTLNNMVDTLLVLPVRRDPVNDLGEVFTLKNSFWLLWDGKLSAANGLVVLLNLAVIAVGLGAAWRKLGWAGLLPLFVLLGYSLSSAVSRNSGWRYILPVDWIGYFTFSTGIMQVLFWLAQVFGDVPSFFNSSNPSDPAPRPRRFQPAGLAALAVVIFLAGASLPLSEVVIPRRYPELPHEQLVRELFGLEAVQTSGTDLAALQAFVSRPDTLVTRGRLFYPRFYLPGEGESGTGWRLYQGMKYPHLSFFLVGPEQDAVVLPLTESPQAFPSASEAWLVGCAGKYWLEPLLVVLPESGAVYHRDPFAPALTCGK